jgi:hypothetical protein
VFASSTAPEVVVNNYRPGRHYVGSVTVPSTAGGTASGGPTPPAGGTVLALP